MRIALGLPSRDAGASRELIYEWASGAERGPFSSLAVTDRVVSQVLEPLAVPAVTAGAPRRIGLMTSVVIGPARFDVANSDHKNQMTGRRSLLLRMDALGSFADGRPFFAK